MKTRLSIGLLVLVALAAGYFMLMPRESAGPAHTQPPAAAPAPASAAPAQAVAARRQALKQKAMEDAYAGLEKDRDTLKRRLGLVRTDVWGLKLPKQQAMSIEDRLLNGYKLLKHPPMLGAFTDVGGINEERARVQGALDDLNQIEQGLKNSGKEPGAGK